MAEWRKELEIDDDTDDVLDQRDVDERGGIGTT